MKRPDAKAAVDKEWEQLEKIPAWHLTKVRNKARIVKVFRWKTTFGGSLGEKGRNNWWCAICGEKNDWKQPNRLLVVQTGESVHQAKVFRAHGVPQGLYGNLVNVLKLLANQQGGWRRPHTEPS